MAREVASAGENLLQDPAFTENRHGTLPQGGHCLCWVPGRRVGHKDAAVDILHVEWDESQRADRGGGCKCAGAEGHRSEGAVEDVNAARPIIIDGIQLCPSRVDSQPRVESAWGGHLGKSRRTSVPRGDRAIQVGKDEVSRRAVPAVSYRKR